MAITKKKKVKCHGECERDLTVNNANFYKSNRKDCVKYNSYYPVCKKCMEKIMVGEEGVPTKESFSEVCKMLNIVFIPNLFKEALLKNALEKNQMKVLSDYRALLTMNATYRDLVFSDTKKFESQNSLGDIKEVKDSSVTVSRELIEFWGEEIEEDTLLAYQEEYENLCTVYNEGMEVKGAKRIYFKNLAILSHKSQQQLLEGDMKGYNTSMTTYANICEKCGINPKQVQDKDDSNKGTFGVFIKMIENEEPIFDPEKDLGSIDVVRRCLEVFFFGHLAEVNGWRNPLKCQYDEVIQQYSVKTDTYEDLMNIEENEEEELKSRRVKKVKLPSLFRKTLKSKVGE